MAILHVLIVIIGTLTPVIGQAQPLPDQSRGTQGTKETIDKFKHLQHSCSAAEIIKDAIQWIKQSPSSNHVKMQGSRLHSPKWRADITGTFDKVTDSQLLMTHPALELFSDRFTPKNDEGLPPGSFGGTRQPFDVNNTDRRTFVLSVTGGKNATLDYGAGSTPKAMCDGYYIYTTEGDELIVLKLTNGQGQK